MEALNGSMGLNFTLCLTPPCERKVESELRSMTANTFQAECLGVLFGHSPRIVMYDDLQVIEGPSTMARHAHAHSRCRKTGCKTPFCFSGWRIFGPNGRTGAAPARQRGG